MNPPTKKEQTSSEIWRGRLTAFRKDKSGEGDKWLQLLYSSYLQQFLSDNNRIWSTGQWMISLSLAPFAVLSNLPRPIDPIKVAFLALPSTVLIWVWLVIAENHRAFQDKSREWLTAIEFVLEVEKPGGHKANSFLTGPGMVKRMRWLLAWGITLAWPTIACLAYVRLF